MQYQTGDRIIAVAFLCIVAVAALGLYCTQPKPPPQEPNIIVLPEAMSSRDNIDRLLDAMIIVESNGRSDAVGDGGRAVGVLQIHPIMVKDINRILRQERFTLADRLDPDKSRAMARIYFHHYCNGMSDEEMARCWNGGPKGFRKPATLKYWHKVERAK